MIPDPALQALVNELGILKLSAQHSKSQDPILHARVADPDGIVRKLIDAQAISSFLWGFTTARLYPRQSDLPQDFADRMRTYAGIEVQKVLGTSENL